MSPLPQVGGARPSVLIVDDERANRMLLEVMLQSEGLDLQIATSGPEALAMIALSPPDLVLLDILMPGMDGFEVALSIKSNPLTKNIPVIVITDLDDRSAKMRGLNVGAEDFLSKPVDRAELCARVRNLLRLKAYGDYHDQYGQMLEHEVVTRSADLVASANLYRATFDTAPVGIVHVALDGQWLRVNQRLCDLLGYSREALKTRAVRELVQSAQTDYASGTNLSHPPERGSVVEKPYRRSDASLMWARVNTAVLRDAAGEPQHFIKVIEDITAQRKLEAQVRQSSKMDAIGQLAAGVAHDFNNLMSVVISYSVMLISDLADADPMYEDLNEIRVAGLRAVELTRQLLAFSRQQVLQPKVVDLGATVHGMENMLRRLIGEDIVLTVTGSPGVGKILIDPSQLEQVIMNLAVNSRDAMGGSGNLTIEIVEVVLDDYYAAEHVGVRAGPNLMLAVSDTGSGIDAATQARMFEPFFTTKELGKGTGLGLSTVFGIVRQSGGTIWCYSELGVGTTFKLYFPITDRVAPATTVPMLDRPLRGDETILLVEDEEGVRALARTILRKYGYEVLEASNGGEAFIICEQHVGTIHLLLTDVVMPRMSGRQLAERLSVMRPEMKVLYMSGYPDDAVVRHGILDATIAFIQKPITPTALARKVRETLLLPQAPSL